jgi:hypothetical protein
MNRDISLFLIGAGIGFIINLAAVLLEMGLKSWAERVNKKRIIKRDFGSIKISTTPEMMKLVNPDNDEGREFKEKSIKRNDGLISKANGKLILKFLSSMTIWALVVYLVARNWEF